MRIKLLILVLMFSLALTGCIHLGDGNNNKENSENLTNGQNQLTYTDLIPEKAKKLIDENPDLVIIDVSPHYASGHIANAINYYWGDGSLEKAIPSLDKEKKYLVYCHVESVSRNGAQAFVDAGFENVYRLDGDYNAWVKAGYEVVK